jgi:hypothetical protein
MNQHERQQIFAAGMRQLVAERNEQGRAEFDRTWRMADVIKPITPEQPKAA